MHGHRRCTENIVNMKLHQSISFVHCAMTIILKFRAYLGLTIRSSESQPSLKVKASFVKDIRLLQKLLLCHDATLQNVKNAQ